MKTMVNARERANAAFLGTVAFGAGFVELMTAGVAWATNMYSEKLHFSSNDLVFYAAVAAAVGAIVGVPAGLNVRRAVLEQEAKEVRDNLQKKSRLFPWE